MFSRKRRPVLLRPLLIAALLATGAGAADAHARHHRRHAVLVSPRVVTTEPESARAARDAGAFAGAFETGIIGATTADPYERRGY